LSSTNKELEEELVKVKKEKIDLEEKLKEKEKEIIELQNESEGNMEKLKELICKLKNQIDRIRKEKNKLEKKLLEEIDRTIKIRREELKNFVEKKILSRNIIGKEKKKRSKIEKLYKKQWQVAKSSGNQELTSSLNEELDKLSKKVKDLIGSENYEKIYNWQEEIIKLEIEQKDLKELTFNESFSYIYDSVITAKEKRLGGLVDQVENKLGKDEEGKKILRNWVSKDDLNEKIFETLKGRGVDEKYRKELDSTKEELIKLKSEKELEMKTKDFLNAQKSFLASRQQTIKELQECCNKLEIFINEKYAVFLEISDAISNIGSAVDSKLTLGVPKIIGETAKTISNFSKIKIAKKSNKEFQLLLGNEEKELSKLRDNFNTLVKFVQFNQELVSNSLFAGILRGKSSTKLFDNKYEVYDVIIKDEVWKGRPLNSERMGKVIVSLSQNFEELEKEVEIQEKQFEEFRDKKHQQLETYQEQFPK
jgi:hypothetical protein